VQQENRDGRTTGSNLLDQLAVIPDLGQASVGSRAAVCQLARWEAIPGCNDWPRPGRPGGHERWADEIPAMTKTGERLDISHDTLQRLITDGELTAINVSASCSRRNLRISLEEI
jgi:hypothetical protein